MKNLYVFGIYTYHLSRVQRKLNTSKTVLQISEKVSTQKRNQDRLSLSTCLEDTSENENDSKMQRKIWFISNSKSRLLLFMSQRGNWRIKIENSQHQCKLITLSQCIARQISWHASRPRLRLPENTQRERLSKLKKDKVFICLQCVIVSRKGARSVSETTRWQKRREEVRECGRETQRIARHCVVGHYRETD